MDEKFSKSAERLKQNLLAEQPKHEKFANSCEAIDEIINELPDFNDIFGANDSEPDPDENRGIHYSDTDPEDSTTE